MQQQLVCNIHNYNYFFIRHLNQLKKNSDSFDVPLTDEVMDKIAGGVPYIIRLDHTYLVNKWDKNSVHKAVIGGSACDGASKSLMWAGREG